NPGYRYFSENTNNYEFLLNQRKLHDAYCSKSLEQKSKLKGPSTIKIDTQRFIKQREKQWKKNHRNMLITLARLHSEEIEKSKKKKLPNKKNTRSKLIS
ncbi:21735_t:CDS:2, partial [Gigaspora rosea]